MLVTPYRVWARRAGEDVSRWMKALSRKWIANGPKMSSEDATYDLAPLTEAATSQGNAVNVK